MGWNLALPAITRRTDKGLPQYRDDGESDIFVLSGAEDLVHVLIRDADGRPRLDEYERDGYRITRYRPRIEGLFARIERWTCLETGEAHWRSISKDNILTVYGLDANSRIADPEIPGHIFSWLICRSYDDRGNAVIYEYSAENDIGVDVAKPAANAPVAGRRTAIRSGFYTAIDARSFSIPRRPAFAAPISSRSIPTPRNGLSRPFSTTARGTIGMRSGTKNSGLLAMLRPSAAPIGRCGRIHSLPIVPALRSALTGCAAGS